MKQAIFKRKGVYILFALLLLSLVYAGCQSTVTERREEPVKREGEAAGKYYHFDDVRIPGELNYKQNRSFVYETPRFKTGILIFTKWRLDVESLVDFFNYQMEKDNWKLVNSFKGKESILNFLKPEKTCTIKIGNNWYSMTEVEIRVGPLGEKKM